MKVLFYGTYPNQGIGYSKIANKITNFLAEQQNIDLYYFGISNFIKKEQEVNRPINSNIKFIDAYKEEKKLGNDELYGVNVFTTFIDKIKPDIIFVYNDMIVISRLFNELIKYYEKNTKTAKIYTYLDIVYEYQRLDMLNHIFNISDKIFVFSDFWKEHLSYILVKNDKIEVLYHGIEKEIFKKEDKLLSKKQCGLSEDSFVILNSNRNTYRKANDITISSFLKFLKLTRMNDKVKLFLNCSLQSPSGYDIMAIINLECIQLSIDYNTVINNHIFIFQDIPNDEKMNYLYNASEIGINTCLGEGFGLCNIEHASIGKPQIISQVGAFNDIFEDVGVYSFVKPEIKYYCPKHTDDHGGYLEFCNSDDFAKLMFDMFNNYDQYHSVYEKFSNKLLLKYDWNTILNNMYEYFQ